jgi:VWFA-related protein
MLSVAKSTRSQPRRMARGRAGEIVVRTAVLWALVGIVERAHAQEYDERVLVERVVVNAHVVDRFSVPIRGLSPKDFVVRVDGKAVALESVEWIGEDPRAEAPGAPAPGAASVDAPSPAVSESEGRSIIMLFEWEVAAQKAVGFVRAQRLAIELVGGMHHRDRVAILLFDSRLWLRQDFTEDKARVAADLEHVLSHDEDRTPRGPDSALARQLSLDDARGATSPEKALELLGNALASTPGKKSLLFFGSQVENWYGRSTVHYGLARRSLSDAQTSVFCVDTSDGRHRLSRNLKQIAADTGGFYFETFDFPRMALRSLERALSGYYVLVFRNPAGPRGQHEIAITLVGRSGTVAHRRFYEDR